MLKPPRINYGLYDCWNCLCEVCTRRYCPKLWGRKNTKVQACLAMKHRGMCPTRKCDFFEHKEIHLVLRVKRKGNHKPSAVILSKLDEILAKLNDSDV